MSVHSVPADRAGQAAAARVCGPAGIIRSDAEVAVRVYAVIAQVNVTEKACRVPIPCHRL